MMTIHMTRAGFMLFILSLGVNQLAAQVGQDETKVEIKKNAFYAEVSVFSPHEIWAAYSINYQRIAFRKERYWLEARIGGGQWAAWAVSGQQLLLGLNLVIGRRNHHFELQAGYNLLRENSDNSIADSYHHPYLQAGYRFQKPSGRVLFKLHSGTYGVANIALGYLF